MFADSKVDTQIEISCVSLINIYKLKVVDKTQISRKSVIITSKNNSMTC